MKNQFLLLEDIDGVGHSGEIVSVKPGFARNFLLPQKKAVVAQKHLVRLQERLREERAKRAVVDRKESEELAKQLSQMSLKTEVKVDAEGHMYGSVSAQDIVHLLSHIGVTVDKKQVALPKPIKEMGQHEILIRLKEGIKVSLVLEIKPEQAT